MNPFDRQAAEFAGHRYLVGFEVRLLPHANTRFANRCNT